MHLILMWFWKAPPVSGKGCAVFKIKGHSPHAHFYCGASFIILNAFFHHLTLLWVINCGCELRASRIVNDGLNLNWTMHLPTFDSRPVLFPFQSLNFSSALAGMILHRLFPWYPLWVTLASARGICTLERVRMGLFVGREAGEQNPRSVIVSQT